MDNLDNLIKAIKHIERHKNENRDYIFLDYYNLTSEDLEYLIKKCKDFFTNLTCLSLKGNNLTYVPKSLNQLTKLIQLDLSANQITDIPTNLSKIKHFKNN